ncbi:MAG TPA: alanine racemase [Candidatus Limnocylindria bacterium]|nr:alanine racemase [Candidatus Limnocylindria bacterium]
MEQLTHRAEAQVDLAAVRSNVERLRAAAPSAELMAVVKADAYGHGLVACAGAARAGGASWLGTALLDEALALRAAGDEGRVLAWLLDPADPFDRAVCAGIDLSASAPWTVAAVAEAARAEGAVARLHLKVDTGLGRAGASKAGWPDLVSAARAAAAEGLVEIVGIWSHLAHADAPAHPTIDAQVRAFEEALDVAKRAGVRPQLRHLANSAATLARPDAHYDLVRPGLAVYGLSPMPVEHPAERLGLRPAMTLVARVALTKRVPAGQGVSYLHRYVTEAETTLALVPLGYADGVPRAATNRGPVLVGGRRRTIAGTVCMDQFVLDVGDDEVAPGDPVVLFGPGDDGGPTAEDWAEALETISYEIVTRVGPRVPRVHLQ